MREFKSGVLHAGSPTGAVVTTRKQAVAIALSEQRQLHPALQAHGAKVAHAHAALVAKHGADFTTLPPAARMRAVQAHIRRGTK